MKQKYFIKYTQHRGVEEWEKKIKPSVVKRLIAAAEQWDKFVLIIPSLILRILKSFANISNSRICGESMAGASSGSRILFLWPSLFISPLGPPGASSVERRAEGSEEKPWLNAQEPLLRPWSGNLYKQEVRDPSKTESGREQKGRHKQFYVSAYLWCME